jgi:hypothetical protein
MAKLSGEAAKLESIHIAREQAIHSFMGFSGSCAPF